MHARFTILGAVVVLLSACGGRDNSTVDSGTGGGTAGTGGGTATGGGTTGTGGGTSAFTVTTVANCFANLSQLSGGGVEVDNAVVTSASTPYASNGSTCVGDKMVETFYIQDKTPAGPGVAVYRSCKDTTPLPKVGDTVTVQGRLAKFDGKLEISSYAKTAIPLNITVTGTGTALGGAVAPAGSPLVPANPAEFAHTGTDATAHRELLGNVLSFPAAKITIQYPPAFVSTSSDGGTTAAGFEITGGIWVDDSIVYFDCLKGKIPNDGGVFALPNGIRGVWDRNQDYYGGTAANPAVVTPVLVPMTCADLQ